MKYAVYLAVIALSLLTGCKWSETWSWGDNKVTETTEKAAE